MELEQITTVVRPRSPWEAMDLGLHLARRWWKEILLPWVLVVVMAAAAIFYLLEDWPQIALLLFWLLKPLYDRVPLYVLSRALFNATPSWRETIAALPSLLTRDLPYLVFRRIDFIRAFNLPVRELEGLRGAASRKRMQLLQRRARGHATWLTSLFIGLETVVMLSLFWLVPLLLPQELNEDLMEQAFFSATTGDMLPWIVSGIYVLTVLLLEPLYVAAGFALYINRRTMLEAWDIELCFRRMAQRLSSSAALLLALVTAGVSLPDSLLAMEPAPRPEVHAEARAIEESAATIEQVLAAPEFATTIKVKQWKYIGEKDEKEDAGFDGFNFGLGKFLARFFEVALWLLLGISLILLIVHRGRWLHLFRAEKKVTRTAAPESLFGLDIRPESLPDNVAELARALWCEGHQREAMSLLYRGALAALVHQQGVEFSSSNTENDCLRILKVHAGSAQLSHFEMLTRAWQQVAYAHRPPEEAVVFDLCESWHEHYEVAAE